MTNPEDNAEERRVRIERTLQRLKHQTEELSQLTSRTLQGVASARALVMARRAAFAATGPHRRQI
jgi:hypothetical protein